MGAQECTPAGVAGGVGGATHGTDQPAANADVKGGRLVWNKAGSGGGVVDLLLPSGSPESRWRVGGGLGRCREEASFKDRATCKCNKSRKTCRKASNPKSSSRGKCAVPVWSCYEL